MSKRTVKFFTLLVLITSVTSMLFITASVLADTLIEDEHTFSIVLSYVRTIFDLIAEFTVYGIVIYCFSRYELKDSLKSFIFAVVSFLLAIVYSLAGTIVYNLVLNEGLSANDIVANIFMSLGESLLLTILTRVIPCIVLAIIVYLCTKRGTKGIKHFISFRNPVQLAMIILTVLLFLINLASALGMDIYIVLSSIPLMTKTEFFDSIGKYILDAIPDYVSIFFYYLLLLYSSLFLVYMLCKKHTENAPIKKTKKVEAVKESTEEASEEE